MADAFSDLAQIASPSSIICFQQQVCVASKPVAQAQTATGWEIRVFTRSRSELACFFHVAKNLRIVDEFESAQARQTYPRPPVAPSHGEHCLLRWNSVCSHRAQVRPI